MRTFYFCTDTNSVLETRLEWASCTADIFPAGKTADVRVTIHLRLAPRLRMSGAVPLRSAYPCGVNSDFYLYMVDFILKRW
jgi:hypothetical protein